MTSLNVAPASGLPLPKASGDPDQAAGPRPTHPRVRQIASALLILAAALAMLVVGILTLFRSRRFQSEVMARSLARAILRVWGITVLVHGPDRWPTGQVIYLANHTSTIDSFVLVSLGLPNTRFFLSGAYKLYLPFALINVLMGTFFTHPQRLPAARTRVFQRADRILRRTGASAYLSPEGRMIRSGEIAPFNKGAFHLATSLRAPIVPLFLTIPSTVDPGHGFVAGSGTIEVDVLDPIATTDWRLEDLEANRDRVREIYLAHHARRRTGSR